MHFLFECPAYESIRLKYDSVLFKPIGVAVLTVRDAFGLVGYLVIKTRKSWWIPDIRFLDF
jgi:hypothetical protein